MDSLIITALLLISVAGISYGSLEVTPEKIYSTNDDQELRDKIIVLESAIKEMSTAKLALDDKMDMLVGEIKQLKEKSESRIHALKEELATTNQHLSKAITVITDIENNALSNRTYGGSVSSTLRSVHKMGMSYQNSIIL
jgi:chromosome segregation ATPase